MGLRAMDYLISRSTPMRQTQLPNGTRSHGVGELGHEKDWDLASPYSVD